MPMEQINPYQVAEVELIYRNKVKPKDRIQISDSAVAHRVLRNSWDENRIELVEQFKILLLDFRNNCLGIAEISSGGMNACPVDLRLLCATALTGKAVKLIAAHNHPTGNRQPSEADKDVTSRIETATNTIDITLVDHLILTPDGYYSFADDGLISQNYPRPFYELK